MRLATIRNQLARIKIAPPREAFDVSFMTSSEQRAELERIRVSCGARSIQELHVALHEEAGRRGLVQRNGLPFPPPNYPDAATVPDALLP